VQAVHHARHRRAFGKALVEQPLMRNVLADLALESEAATALAFRVTRAVDARARDPRERALARLVTAVGKYWVCKRAMIACGEALECLGGNGYVEESKMPRLFREAPLNSIWEGSGNVNALDVLRAMVKSPESVEAFRNEIGEAAGAEPRLDRYGATIVRELSDTEGLEYRARRLVERMAIALQASILVRHGDPAVADAFCATRLDGDRGRAFGTLPTGVDCSRIVERHRPQL